MKKAFFLLILSVLMTGSAFAGGSVPVLTAPNGGTLTLNKPYNITWGYSGVTHVKLVLRQNETLVGVIAPDIHPSIHSYNWTVGQLANGTKVKPGTGFKVRVRTVDNGPYDDSDSSITITEDGGAAGQKAGPKVVSKGLSGPPPGNVSALAAGLLPDLRLSALKVFETSSPMNTKDFFLGIGTNSIPISICAVVENIGDSESKPTSVRIKIVSSLTPSSWTMPGPTYDIKIPALNPKTKADAIATHTFTEEGTFWAIAQIDPENKIAEKDESNNGFLGNANNLDAMIVIKKRFVDLSPGIEMLGSKAFVIVETEFEVSVSNNGTIPSEACRMRVEFTPDDKKYINVPVIVPGPVPFTVKVKHRYPVAGPKTVRVVVDPDKKNTKESNWDNNKTQIRINVHLN